MISSTAITIFLCFVEMLYVPVLANDVIKNVEWMLIKDVDTLAFRQKFTYLFDSLITSGFEERDAEIAALNSVLGSMVPYTEVMTPKEFGNLVGRGGQISAGVGLIIVKENERVVVIKSVCPGPAHNAGINMGDCLIDIDDTLLENLDIKEIQQLLTGEPGSVVNVRVMKINGIDTTNYELKREKIYSKNSVSRYQIIDQDVGYIHILQFLASACEEIKGIVDSMESAGVKKLIIDLRYNNGGLLQQSIDVISLFLPKGKEIVRLQNLRKKKVRRYKSSTSNSFSEHMPLVLIVNNSSHAAAEIFAGALQDWDRALIIGDTTAGRGIIQHLVELSFGYGMRFTTFICYLPSGRKFDKFFYNSEKKDTKYTTKNLKREVGNYCIVPDIILSQKHEPNIYVNINEDIWIKRALNILNEIEDKDDVFEVIEH